MIIDGDGGRPAAAMPLFRKAHSRGEFVFDFSWANAYAQHGLKYYPKLLTAVPFTPVCGPRLLISSDADIAATTHDVVRAVLEHARAEQLSSWHVLFPADDIAAQLEDAGLILRRDCQFHWFNQGYDSLRGLPRHFHRREAQEGEARTPARRRSRHRIRHPCMAGTWMRNCGDTVYGFYADTFYRHGHEPYLNLDFFKRVAAAMPDELMLKIARLGGEPIAVAIFFVGEEALFGRYWGAGGNYHSLHFEACYYQGIEYCIEKKLQRFEPGTQGEHKVPRGFVPTLTRSAHFIADPRFAAAIRDFARREARGVDRYAAAVNEHVPYHRAPDEELQI